MVEALIQATQPHPNPRTEDEYIEAVRVLYRSKEKRTMDMARLLMECIRVTGLSQQALGRATGISAGAIRHYLGLIYDLAPDLADAVEAGRLQFRVARALASIEGYNRQRETAKPFMRGRLPAMRVDELIRLVKQHPDVAVDEIVTWLLYPEQLSAARLPQVDVQQTVEQKPKRPDPDPIGVEDLHKLVLDVAAHIDTLSRSQVAEYHRMQVRSALRILDTRVHVALDVL